MKVSTRKDPKVEYEDGALGKTGGGTVEDGGDHI
jgi:hypothetical protein